MALILPFGGREPRIGRGVFVAPNATVIGDVVLEDESSVWFGAVLRGDIGAIRIGPRTNVQDLVCAHITDGQSSTILGADVTVGHGAILHSCVVGDRCLIGMGAILLDNAVIEPWAFVAAGTLVPPGKVVRSGKMVMGNPFREVRDLTDKDRAWIVHSWRTYVARGREYRAEPG